MKQNDFITVHDEDNNDIIIINIKYIYRITVHEAEPIIIQAEEQLQMPDP